ncbi:hypothetical protein PG993_008137 [Apiospora rasikravindrae]|uniref:Uncharacterized protein n=1 Tax=Apiospora rasikravindrae TaxID=990691 RepID=A0ABR1T0W5_9PEZI
MPSLLWRVVDGDAAADARTNHFRGFSFFSSRLTFAQTQTEWQFEDVAFTVEPKKPREYAAIVEP